MRRHVLLLAAALALVAAGCGSDDQRADEGPLPQITTTTSTTVQATAAAAPAVKVGSVKDAATRLYDAWKAGDRPKALGAASQSAVNALFAQPFNPAQLRGCDEPGQLGADCFFRYPGGAIRMHVTGDASSGFVVETAEFLAD